MDKKSKFILNNVEKTNATSISRCIRECLSSKYGRYKKISTLLVDKYSHNTGFANSYDSNRFLAKEYEAWYYYNKYRIENLKNSENWHEILKNDSDRNEYFRWLEFFNNYDFSPEYLCKSNANYAVVLDYIRLKYLFGDNLPYSYCVSGNFTSKNVEDCLITKSSHYYEEKRYKDDEYKAGFYLNLRLENVFDFVSLFRERCSKDKLPFILKVLNNDKKCFTCQITTNYGNAQKVLDVIKDIQIYAPELFDGAEKISPIFSSLKETNCVGFGEVKGNGTKSTGYVDDRIGAISDAVDDTYRQEKINTLFEKSLQDSLCVGVVGSRSNYIHSLLRNMLETKCKDEVVLKNWSKIADKMLDCIMSGKIKHVFEIDTDSGIEIIDFGKFDYVGEVAKLLFSSGETKGVARLKQYAKLCEKSIEGVYGNKSLEILCNIVKRKMIAQYEESIMNESYMDNMKNHDLILFRNAIMDKIGLNNEYLNKIIKSQIVSQLQLGKRYMMHFVFDSDLLFKDNNGTKFVMSCDNIMDEYFREAIKQQLIENPVTSKEINYRMAKNLREEFAERGIYGLKMLSLSGDTVNSLDKSIVEEFNL